MSSVEVLRLYLMINHFNVLNDLTYIYFQKMLQIRTEHMDITLIKVPKRAACG